MRRNKIMAVAVIGAARVIGVSTTAAAKGKGKGDAEEWIPTRTRKHPILRMI